MMSTGCTYSLASFNSFAGIIRSCAYLSHITPGPKRVQSCEALSHILEADTFRFSEPATMEVSITITSTSTGLIDYRYHQIRRGFIVLCALTPISSRQTRARKFDI